MVIMMWYKSAHNFHFHRAGAPKSAFCFVFFLALVLSTWFKNQAPRVGYPGLEKTLKFQILQDAQWHIHETVTEQMNCRQWQNARFLLCCTNPCHFCVERVTTQQKGREGGQAAYSFTSHLRCEGSQICWQLGTEHDCTESIFSPIWTSLSELQVPVGVISAKSKP